LRPDARVPSVPGRPPHPTEVAAAGAATLLLLAAIAAGPPQLKMQFWDDAYMFARYADNLRTTGRLTWNPGGPPTYGPTSVFYTIFAVLPVRLAIPGNVSAALVASSALCMGLFVTLALWFAWRSAARRPRAQRWTLFFLVSAALLGARGHLHEHATSGMDTAFAMSYLMAYLIAAGRYERAASLSSGAFLGVLGGLAMGVRPDLMLFTLSVPGAIFVASPVRERKSALVPLAVTAGVCLAWLAASRLYFGSALPLSFYAKATHLYRDFNEARFAPVPCSQLKSFCLANCILLVVLAASIAVRVRNRRVAIPPIRAGAMAGAAAFSIYYTTSVLQIMYHAARFYYPVLPALVYVCIGEARGLLRCADGRRWASASLVWLTVLSVALLPPLREMGRPLDGVASLDVWESARTLYRRRWFALEAFSHLPDAVAIATTEVGHAAAMNPGKTIVDYAGLNDAAFARQPFSADRLVARHCDVVYLPHPDYRGMVADLLSNAAFREEYELHSSQELHALLGVAIRRKSASYDAMARILAMTEKE